MRGMAYVMRGVANVMRGVANVMRGVAYVMRGVAYVMTTYDTAVKPLLKDTPEMRTPLYQGQFAIYVSNQLKHAFFNINLPQK